MSKKSIFRTGIISILIVFFALQSKAQIQVVGCYSSDGRPKGIGQHWPESRNGVSYDCVCTGSGTKCTPVSSSSSSSSSSGGGGYSPQVQMAHDLLQPLVTNFFKWLSSGPSNKPTQQREEVDNKKPYVDYRAKMIEQIANAKNDFESQSKSRFGEQKESTLSELKERFAKSEATKAVKQASCAAYTKILLLKTVLDNFNDFKDLNGPAEQERTLADFSNGFSKDCPEINIDIKEVTAVQPVSFQELLYDYVAKQSDSIKVTIDTLKVKKVKNDQLIAEKKQKVEEVKQVIEKKKAGKNPAVAVNQDADDQLTKDAMKELEMATKQLQAAEEGNQKIKEDIASKEKNVETLEKMRSTYDVPKKPITTEPPVIK